MHYHANVHNPEGDLLSMLVVVCAGVCSVGFDCEPETGDVENEKFSKFRRHALFVTDAKFGFAFVGHV